MSGGRLHPRPDASEDRPDSAPGADRIAVNLAVVRGRLSRPPEDRVLPSGERLAVLDITIAARDGHGAESVPVAWYAPPTGAALLDVGGEIVAVGRVRRRFFRVGGATQSRTEVVAEAVVPARLTKRVEAAVARAVARELGTSAGAAATRP